MGLPRRALAPLLAVTAVGALVFALYGPPAEGLSRLFLGGPPEARVAAYLDATARGDESTALSAWKLWDCCVPRPALEARRSELTKQLAGLGVGRVHRILFTEWWTSCCMPTITADPEHAGRARIFVSATDRSGGEHELVFDVEAEKRQSLGAGHDLGPWILREVYRRGERSAMGGPAAPLTEDGAIRSAQSATGIGLQRDAPGVAPGSHFAVKRSTLGDLKRQLGADDFVVPADPARNVFIVAATGPAFRGGETIPASAVVVLDADDHLVLGIDLRERSEIPAYFDRLP